METCGPWRMPSERSVIEPPASVPACIMSRYAVYI